MVACSASRLTLHGACTLVGANPHELGMAQQAVARPFYERPSATILGLTQRNAVMSLAVMPSPQWPVLLLGRLLNGQRGCTVALRAGKSSARMCGVGPALTLLANVSFRPSE
jgi:hypothetical protein